MNGSFTLSVLGPGEDLSRNCLFDQPFALIGRHASNSIPLEDNQVSQRHAYLQVLAGRLFCIDLGSRTGIYRGTSTFSSGWVYPGEEIRIGPFGICCPSLSSVHGDLWSGVPSDPLVQRVNDPDLFPDVSVDIMQDGARLSRWRMNRCLVMVGHDPGARLRLRDRTVSRFHCSLVGTPAGVWVVDLLGRGGTLLNGLPVSATRISTGDCLRVGCYELRFTCQPGLPRPRVPMSLSSAPPLLVDRPSRNMAPVPTSLGPTLDGSALLPLFQQLGMQQQTIMDQFQQSMLFMVQMFMKMHQDQVGMLREELAQLQELTAQIQAAQQQLLSRGTPPEPRPAPAPATRVAPAPPVAAPSPRVPEPAGTANGPAASPPVVEADNTEFHAWLSGQIADMEKQRQTLWQRVLGVMFGR